MNITIQLNGDEGTHELNALAALIASLGGRAPTASPVMPELTVAEALGMGLDEPGMLGRVRTPGDDEAEPRNTDTSELDADVIDAAVLAGAPAADSAGIPWDARIHSESRATIADGTWRKRRNVSQDVYDSVLAELTAAGGAVPPPPATTTNDTPEPPAPTVADTAPVAVGATSAGEAAAATTAADVPPPPSAATGPDLSTWPKFVQSVQSKDVPDSAKIYDALNKLANETFSVGKFLEMKDRPNDWAMFYDMVG